MSKSSNSNRRMLSLCTAITVFTQQYNKSSAAFIPTITQRKGRYNYYPIQNIPHHRSISSRLHVKERERQADGSNEYNADFDAAETDDNADESSAATTPQKIDLISLSNDETGDFFNPFESSEEEQAWLPDAKLVELATKIDERLTNRNVKTDQKYRAAETFYANGDDEDEEDPLARAHDPSPKAWDDPNELKKVITGSGDKQQNAREEGYLGDSTLNEIASDYSIPSFYLADIVCSWGVSPPIDMDMKLGDVLLGEQAFALLEALNSFDPSDLYDLYSRYDLRSFAGEYDVEMKNVFEFAVKEGFSLPFGVHSRLRKDQVEMLERYFDPDGFWEGDYDDDDGFDDGGFSGAYF
uniref:Uncharacterized protein n=1 Tax=Leptocylindrus danicus TaxID=163516 RepID=A0A7S2L468_9STRA